MALIPDDTISEIRGKADIVAIIGRHVDLKKAGRNHKGLCPFHNENSPSFSVSSDKGFYYCFGCQQKGDVFTFLMEYEGKSFSEAAESLASQLGVLIPESSKGFDGDRERTKRGRFLEITSLATDFFRRCLEAPSGALAVEYLKGRGITGETASTFRLGYAPDGWDGLVSFLREKNASLAAAEALGLIVKRPQSEGYYDRFRDRLMCPVIETNGDIVGFSGRRLQENSEKAGAKYINSPESSLYKKSKLLYGLHQARDGIRKAGHALLVEGNFDVISLYQAGFTQVVAALGTALTDDQAGILRRVASTAVLLYDGDPAGRAATIKALKTLLRNSVDVRVALLSNGQDPDNMVQSGAGAELRQLIERAQPAVEYFIHEVWRRDDHSAHARSAALAEAAEVLRCISDPTQRDFAVGTLATAWRVDEETLRKGLRRALAALGAQKRGDHQPSDVPSPQVSPGAPKEHPLNSLELDILAILVEYPQLMPVAEELEVSSSLTERPLQDMYSAFRLAERPEDFLAIATTDSTLLGASVSKHFANHVLNGVFQTVSAPESCLRQAVGQLRASQAKAQLKSLQRRAEEANRHGNTELERALFRQILETRKQVE